ncbi:MAG: dihydropteroate synthase [Candidatus Altimarinota bacterium]
MTLSFEQPLIMGILNLTPDSFSDGGKYFPASEGEVGEPRRKKGENIHSRLQMRFLELISDGADIIDIGAESTFGPESQVSAEEEWRRLQPVLKSLVETQDLASLPVISLDTWKSEVAHRALQMGVHMINDVTALRGDPRMIEVLLEYQPYVCLMYSAYDTPYAGREEKQYEDVMATIQEFLKARTEELINRGFPKEKIIVDPGLGIFLSSDPQVSWEVIERLGELKDLGFPILIGPSMKSFLGGEIKDRLQNSLEAAKKCLEKGASILRVHHVKDHAPLLPRA